MRLLNQTTPEWTTIVLNDFNAFLADHALCERKAAASAMALVTRYPQHPELVRALVDLAAEEITHFQQVVHMLLDRGLILPKDDGDPYVAKLQQFERRGHHQFQLLDRLLISGIIEARSCERFMMLTDAMPDSPLREYYLETTRSEARHHGLFVRLAKLYFDPQLVEDRLHELLVEEAQIINELPLRAAVH